MAFNLLQLIVLSFVGCNAGVVPQHFISNHTEPDNVDIEKVPSNFSKNESDSSLGTIKMEILSIGDGDHHNSSEVSIIGFHNTSEELNLTKINISEKSHPIVSNHSKEFDHSHKGDTKGLGRPRKKSSKGSNRSKKTSSKETKHVEKVTKDHFKNDSLKDLHHSEGFTRELSRPFKKVTHGHSLNDSHHLEDLSRELSHNVKDSNMSDHVETENLKEDHFKVSLNDHTEDFMKGSNHFDKNVSDVTDHVENITKIDSNQKGFNGSDHADEIVIDFFHFTALNESHRQDVLNNSHFDVAKEFLDFDNVTKPVHQIEQNVSKHFENVPETGNDTMIGFNASKDFQMTEHFDITSGKLDETAESLSNSFKISDDHIPLKEHVDNVSDINNHRDSSMNSFHDDSIHKIDMDTHSEKPASEMDSHIQHESFNSSKIILNDSERLSSEMDNFFITKENSSLDSAWLHKDSDFNSTLSNQLNETNSNDTPVTLAVSPIDDTNSTTDLSHEFRDLEVSTNESKLNSVTNDHVATEKNATQSLFSGIGLGFLFNSELAKNAASAMEVFNFTDSALTDHIMDDKNDVHDFLDIIHPPVESDQSDSKENMRENLNETEIDPELNSTSGVIITLHPQTLLNSTIDEETTTMLSSILLNSTVEFEETTMVSQPMLNSTVEFEETTIVSNSTVLEAICPPPGICIFWFLAQDTCAVNSHCLGSRICCRIGCAKTCIEV